MHVNNYIGLIMFKCIIINCNGFIFPFPELSAQVSGSPLSLLRCSGPRSLCALRSESDPRFSAWSFRTLKP